MMRNAAGSSTDHERPSATEWLESAVAIMWTFFVSIGLIAGGVIVVVVAWADAQLVLVPGSRPVTRQQAVALTVVWLIALPLEWLTLSFLNRRLGRADVSATGVALTQPRFEWWLRPLAAGWWLGHLVASLLLGEMMLAMYRHARAGDSGPPWMLSAFSVAVPLFVSFASTLYLLLAATSLSHRRNVVGTLWRLRWPIDFAVTVLVVAIRKALSS